MRKELKSSINRAKNKGSQLFVTNSTKVLDQEKV